MDEDDDLIGQDGVQRVLNVEMATARGLLKAAEDSLIDSLQLFEIRRDEIRDGLSSSDRDFNDALRMITKARLNLIQETRNYEKSVLSSRGLIAEAPLDLDAIRLEIGSKLDRLRDTA